MNLKELEEDIKEREANVDRRLPQHYRGPRYPYHQGDATPNLSYWCKNANHVGCQGTSADYCACACHDSKAEEEPKDESKEEKVRTAADPTPLDLTCGYPTVRRDISGADPRRRFQEDRDSDYYGDPDWTVDTNGVTRRYHGPHAFNVKDMM